MPSLRPIWVSEPPCSRQAASAVQSASLSLPGRPPRLDQGRPWVSRGRGLSAKSRPIRAQGDLLRHMLPAQDMVGRSPEKRKVGSSILPLTTTSDQG